jgi:hypothetical protein
MIKKLLLILICLPFIGFGQNVNIPDSIFKAILVADSEIQVSESAVAEYIKLYHNPGYNVVSDLTGIEHFTSLIYFSYENHQLTSPDLGNNTALTHLPCYNNRPTHSLHVKKEG